MSFLLNIFARSSAPTARQIIQKSMQQLRIDKDEPLPDNYYEQLIAENAQHYSRSALLSEIIRYLQEVNNEAGLVKIYTIIMSIVRMSDYDDECCEILEQLQDVTLYGNTTGEKSERLRQLEKSCKSYLIKLSSMSELYRASLSQKPSEFLNDGHVNLFRMMNQFYLLFPHLNTSINTVGRYYKEVYLYYKQFYRVWRSQILLGYLAIKKSVDQLIKNYQKKDQEILTCFLVSIPEIELLCDEMESFITNKYYKGKSPNKKIYFKEDTLQEIEYYVAMSNQQKGKIDDDFIKTAEDDFFSMLKQ